MDSRFDIKLAHFLQHCKSLINKLVAKGNTLSPSPSPTVSPTMAPTMTPTMAPTPAPLLQVNEVYRFIDETTNKCIHGGVGDWVYLKENECVDDGINQSWKVLAGDDIQGYVIVDANNNNNNKVCEQNGWGDIRLKDYIVDNAYQRWIARDSLSNPDGVILENKGNSQQRYFLRTPTSDGQRIKVRTNKAAAATWNITTVTTIL